MLLKRINSIDFNEYRDRFIFNYLEFKLENKGVRYIIKKFVHILGLLGYKLEKYKYIPIKDEINNRYFLLKMRFSKKEPCYKEPNVYLNIASIAALGFSILNSIIPIINLGFYIAIFLSLLSMILLIYNNFLGRSVKKVFELVVEGEKFIKKELYENGVKIIPSLYCFSVIAFDLKGNCYDVDMQKYYSDIVVDYNKVKYLVRRYFKVVESEEKIKEIYGKNLEKIEKLLENIVE